MRMRAFVRGSWRRTVLPDRKERHLRGTRRLRLRGDPWESFGMRRVGPMSLAWGIVLFANAALAGTPASLRIVGDDKACPTPGQVGGLLGPLLPASKISASGGPSGMDDITIYDDGASFR